MCPSRALVIYKCFREVRVVQRFCCTLLWTPPCVCSPLPGSHLLFEGTRLSLEGVGAVPARVGRDHVVHRLDQVLIGDLAIHIYTRSHNTHRHKPTKTGCQQMAPCSGMEASMRGLRGKGVGLTSASLFQMPVSLPFLLVLRISVTMA